MDFRLFLINELALSESCLRGWSCRCHGLSVYGRAVVGLPGFQLYDARGCRRVQAGSIGVGYLGPAHPTGAASCPIKATLAREDGLSAIGDDQRLGLREGSRAGCSNDRGSERHRRGSRGGTTTGAADVHAGPGSQGVPGGRGGGRSASNMYNDIGSPKTM